MNENALNVQLTENDYLAANYLHAGWKRFAVFYLIGTVVVGSLPFFPVGESILIGMF